MDSLAAAIFHSPDSGYFSCTCRPQILQQMLGESVLGKSVAVQTVRSVPQWQYGTTDSMESRPRSQSRSRSPRSRRRHRSSGSPLSRHKGRDRTPSRSRSRDRRRARRRERSPSRSRSRDRSGGLQVRLTCSICIVSARSNHISVAGCTCGCKVGVGIWAWPTTPVDLVHQAGLRERVSTIRNGAEIIDAYSKQLMKCFTKKSTGKDLHLEPKVKIT